MTVRKSNSDPKRICCHENIDERSIHNFVQKYPRLMWKNINSFPSGPHKITIPSFRLEYRCKHVLIYQLEGRLICITYDIFWIRIVSNGLIVQLGLDFKLNTKIGLDTTHHPPQTFRPLPGILGDWDLVCWHYSQV